MLDFNPYMQHNGPNSQDLICPMYLTAELYRFSCPLIIQIEFAPNKDTLALKYIGFAISSVYKGELWVLLSGILS
jgi:hypothetical protein